LALDALESEIVRSTEPKVVGGLNELNLREPARQHLAAGIKRAAIHDYDFWRKVGASGSHSV
jgi:hypothetical protein